MFRESEDFDYGASSGEDRAAGLRPQPLRVFAEQHPSREAAVLEQAAEIAATGWTQGAFSKDADGSFSEDTMTAIGEPVAWCALGAIAKAADFNPDGIWDHCLSDRAQRLLAKAVGCELREIGNNIPHWNDAPERTQAEVVAKLRQAAQLARVAA